MEEPQDISLNQQTLSKPTIRAELLRLMTHTWMALASHMGTSPASIYGHLPVRTMQIMLDIRHARVHEMMSNTLELCLLSFRTSISVKLELHAEALAGGTSYTIPFGMGLDAARPVHVAPSIIHLGFAMSFRNQPLITSKFGSALIRETVTKICPLRRLSCMFSNKSLFCCIDSCCKVL